MTEEKARQLLQKYVNGEANAAEIKQVEDWYAQLDSRKNSIPVDQKEIFRKKLLGNIQAAMADKQRKKHRFIPIPLLRIAAVVFMVISLGLLYWKLTEQPVGNMAEIVATTGVNQHKKITLSDGSEIILQPSSSISYPSQFNGTSRQVKLTEGEAFFAVFHDEKHPFQVQLPSNLAVKVLGTSFRIKAYRTSHQVEVAVATGKVAVQQQGKILGLLTKDQSFVYSTQTKQAKRNVMQEHMPVTMAFHGATLHEVTKKLAYVYNIRISIKDPSLATLKTTATFTSTQSPQEILDIICSLHHIKYRTKENLNTFQLQQ